MHRSLVAVFIGASMLAAPAFAQVLPSATGRATASGSAQAGMATQGIHASGGAGTSTSGSSGTQPLGLGGLLQQAQAPAPVADTPVEGAGPTGELNAKARAKRHAARGH